MLEVFGRGFQLLEADAYSLRYQEKEAATFPWADYDKVRGRGEGRGGQARAGGGWERGEGRGGGRGGEGDRADRAGQREGQQGMHWLSTVRRWTRVTLQS